MKRNKTLQSDPMEQQQLSPSLMIYTRCMLQDTELTTKSARKADPSVASISVKGVALIYPAIFCGHLPSWASALTVLTPQSRFGGKLLENWSGLPPKRDCFVERVNVPLLLLALCLFVHQQQQQQQPQHCFC